MEPSDSQDQSAPVSKLRTSCDSCLQAKVKCEKTGTACRRCTSIGSCCQFSPSKRCGKPPASLRKASSDLRPPEKKSKPTPSIVRRRTKSPSASTGSPTTNTDSMLPLELDMLVTSMPGDTWMSDRQPLANAHDPLHADALFPETSFKSTCVSGQSPGWGWDFMDPLYSTNSDLQWTASMHDMQVPATTMPPDPDLQRSFSTQTTNDCRHQQQECASLALNALNSLYPNGDASQDFVFSSGAFTPPSSRVSDSGAPLYIHTNAIDIVQQILRCNCSLEVDVALSCMAIVYRVLSSFTGPLNPSSTTSTTPVLSCGSSGASSSSSPTPTKSQMAFQQQDTTAPKWETDTEIVMQRVAMLQEMRRVAHLFDSLAERRSVTSQAEGAHEILSALSKSLRARLSAAMGDVADMSNSLAMTYA